MVISCHSSVFFFFLTFPHIARELSERARSAPLVKKFSLPASEILVNGNFLLDFFYKKNLPSLTRCTSDYSAALLKHILIHGRMYVSWNYVCFESKIFGIKTVVCIIFILILLPINFHLYLLFIFLLIGGDILQRYYSNDKKNQEAKIYSWN